MYSSIVAGGFSLAFMISPYARTRCYSLTGTGSLKTVHRVFVFAPLQSAIKTRLSPCQPSVKTGMLMHQDTDARARLDTPVLRTQSRPTIRKTSPSTQTPCAIPDKDGSSLVHSDRPQQKKINPPTNSR